MTLSAQLRALFAAILLLLPVAAVAQTTSAPASPIRAYSTGPDHPTTTGFHKLVFTFTEAGQKHEIPFSLFLPSGYGKDDRRWPMLTFMAGLGDRGPDPMVSMGVGVPLEVGRDPELQSWLPMIVLTPQCPNDQVWESPGMPAKIIRLINAVADTFAVDRDRLYATGFSNGGRGAWALAVEDPDLFAVTAPIVSREHDAQATAARLAGRGTTCLVISGQSDPKSEPASAHMVEALRKQGVDVVYSPVPKAEHFIWAAFYREKAFYEFLLMHRRGQAPPTSRMTGEAFAALYAAKPQSSVHQIVFQHKIQHDLDRFEQYWFVDNCAQTYGVGLQREALARQNVYSTFPLTREVACRLQTTRQLPKDKWTRLTVEAGHPPRGEWELVIRVNEQEVARRLVNDDTAPTGWLEEVINLQSLAGQEARLQLIHQSTSNPNPRAFWSKIKLTESTPK